MVTFNERYGFEIVFPKTIEMKISSLSEEEIDFLRNDVYMRFPMIDSIHSDLVTFNEDFADYRWDKEDKKQEIVELDKQLRIFILNWFKRKILGGKING